MSRAPADTCHCKRTAGHSGSAHPSPPPSLALHGAKTARPMPFHWDTWACVFGPVAAILALQPALHCNRTALALSRHAGGARVTGVEGDRSGWSYRGHYWVQSGKSGGRGWKKGPNRVGEERGRAGGALGGGGLASLREEHVWHGRWVGVVPTGAAKKPEGRCQNPAGANGTGSGGGTLTGCPKGMGVVCWCGRGFTNSRTKRPLLKAGGRSHVFSTPQACR